jgi:hypothetical protein
MLIQEFTARKDSIFEVQTTLAGMPLGAVQRQLLQDSINQLPWR